MSEAAADPDDPTEIGEAIRAERIRRGLTAEEAAARAGLAYKTWLRIESGKPVRNMSWAGVDRVFDLPSGSSLRNRTNLDGLNALFDAHRLLYGPKSEEEITQAVVKAIRIMMPQLSEEQARELHANVLVPAFRGKDDVIRLEAHSADSHASLIPTQPGLDELLADEEQHADEIIQLLPELSLEDLDKVITAANATRNSRVTEISKMMKLPPPMHFRRSSLSIEQIQNMSPGMHMRWLNLNRQYSMAHQEAVRTLARKLDSDQPGESDGAAEEAVRTATQYAGELAALINLTRRNEREEVHDGER